MRKIILLLLMLVYTNVCAKEVSFTWTANSGPIDGYKLYYKIGQETNPPYDGTDINEGISPISIDKSSTTTSVNVADNEYYVFTLTAYNSSGESDYSNIAIVTPEMQAPVIISIGVLGDI